MVCRYCNGKGRKFLSINVCEHCGGSGVVDYTLEEMKVLIIIGSVLNKSLEEVMGSKVKLLSELGMDTLDEVEIIMELEKEFRIAIPEESEGTFLHVSDFFRVINKQ